MSGAIQFWKFTGLSRLTGNDSPPLQAGVFVVVRFIARSKSMLTGNKLPYYKPTDL